METSVHMRTICSGFAQYELRPNHATELEGATFCELDLCGGS